MNNYPCKDRMPPESLFCTPEHCRTFMSTSMARAFCKCIDWQGKPIPDCIPKGPFDPVATGTCYNRVTKEQRTVTAENCWEMHDQDPNWIWTVCYCCCTGVSGEELEVRISEGGAKPLTEVTEADDVWSASIEIKGGKLTISWSPRKVGFSGGTSGGGEGYKMLFLHHGDGRRLTATSDQLFLCADGRLKPAKRLKLGDLLLSDAGHPVRIEGLEQGLYDGRIHHIGLGPMPPGGEVPVDGHLLSIGGIISGDYWLQLMRAQEFDSLSAGEEAGGDAVVAAELLHEVVE